MKEEITLTVVYQNHYTKEKTTVIKHIPSQSFGEVANALRDICISCGFSSELVTEYLGDYNDE